MIQDLNSKMETEKQKLLQSISLAKQANSGQGTANLIREILEQSKAKTDELAQLFVQVNNGAKSLIENESSLQAKNRDLKQENEDLRERVKAVDSERMQNQFGIKTSTGNPLLEDDDDVAYPAHAVQNQRLDLDQAIHEDAEDFFGEPEKPPVQTSNQQAQSWDSSAQLLQEKPVQQNPPGFGAAPEPDEDDFFGEPPMPPVQPPAPAPAAPAQDEEDFFGEDSKPSSPQTRQPSLLFLFLPQ